MRISVICVLVFFVLVYIQFYLISVLIVCYNSYVEIWSYLFNVILNRVYSYCRNYAWTCTEICSHLWPIVKPKFRLIAL
jgi:hypothetical protein